MRHGVFSVVVTHKADSEDEAPQAAAIDLGSVVAATAAEDVRRKARREEWFAETDARVMLRKTS